MDFDFYECATEASELAEAPLKLGADWKSVRRSAALVMRDFANRGYNLFSVVEGTVALTAGQASYALPATLIDVTDAVIRENAATAEQFDFVMSRMPQAQYSSTANKLLESRPTQFTVRRTPTPTLYVYPTSDVDRTLVYWGLQHSTEPTSGTDTIPLPLRFTPAFIAGLAYHLAIKRNPGKVQLLKAHFDETMQLAVEEDRDRASFFVMPRVEAR